MGMKFCTTFLLVKLALFVDLAAPELARSLPKRGLPIFNRDAVLLEVREEWQRRGRLDLDTEGIGQRLGYLVVLWPEAFLEFVLLQQKLLPCAFACKSQSAIRLACARAAHAASEVIGAIAVDCAGSSRRLHP